MNDIHTTHPQDLRARIAGIISMMLVILRAHGWRGLIHLPTLWLVSREIRRIGEQFAALMAAFKAGTLPPVPAQIPTTPRLPACPDARPIHARATGARTAPCRRPSQSAPAQPARRQLARPYPCPAPDPQHRPGRSADILVSARST